MFTVTVTGSTGYLGRVLLSHLERDPEVGTIISIGRRPLEYPSSKLRHHRLDLSDPTATGPLAELLRGSDALVHMAFTLFRRPGQSSQAITQANIAGSRNIFEAAVRGGIRRILFTSSIVAYGMHLDNPVPLTEEHPLRPNPGHYYAQSKAAVERLLDEIAQEHAEITTTRLRPCAIVGPHITPEQGAVLRPPVLITTRGANPRTQLVHEDDVAQAILLALQRDLPGAYNVVPDDTLSQEELAELGGVRVVALPFPVARLLLALAWRLGQSPYAPEWADFFRCPMGASNARLRASGWRPAYTTAQAYLSLPEVAGQGTRSG